MARAGAGVHRPLRVGRHEDQAAPGRRRRRDRRRFEPHAEREHVMREDGAELVVSDLADERRIEPERGGARHAVRRRSAADLARRPHRRVELVGLCVGQQLHAAFGQAVPLDERIVGGRDHVDDRVADRDDVEGWELTRER